MVHIRMLLTTGLFALLAPMGLTDDRKADQPFDDATFVTKGANCLQRDIEISKIATTSARNEEVKKFAKKMNEECTTAQTDLKKIATAMSVSWPDKIDEEAQKKVDATKDYKGDNFDRDFLKCVIEEHEKAVKHLTQASKEAKSEDLRNFATKQLPLVEKCVAEAKKLQETVK